MLNVGNLVAELEFHRSSNVRLFVRNHSRWFPSMTRFYFKAVVEKVDFLVTMDAAVRNCIFIEVTVIYFSFVIKLKSKQVCNLKCHWNRVLFIYPDFFVVIHQIEWFCKVQEEVDFFGIELSDFLNEIIVTHVCIHRIAPYNSDISFSISHEPVDSAGPVLDHFYLNHLKVIGFVLSVIILLVALEINWLVGWIVKTRELNRLHERVCYALEYNAISVLTNQHNVSSKWSLGTDCPYLTNYIIT